MSKGSNLFQREIECEFRAMSERKSRRKSVNVTFSGDDDVVQHIVDSRNAKPGEFSSYLCLFNNCQLD